MQRDEVENRVNRALDALYDKDYRILEINTKEETIAHRLAVYLDNEFRDWDVDCEYNRRGDETKRLFQGKRNSVGEPIEEIVLPDILVHARDTDGNNLLVIEVKKSTNPDNGDEDRKKLRAFVTESKYEYQYGLFIRIDAGKNCERDRTLLEWFTRDDS
jgi:hypothetical protein